MYRKLDDFIKDWIQESHSTHNLLTHISDASLDQQIDAGGWTLGRLAWHLAATISEMARIVGVPISGPSDNSPVPESAAAIAEAYEQAANSLLIQITTGLTDEMLLEELSVYGHVWTRGETLAVLVRHQTHHRGQMTVLMRQAGLCPPGVCGPSREEMAELIKQMSAAVE